jgi:hypothetical protein
MSGNTTAVAIWKKCDSPCASATRLMVRMSDLSVCSKDLPDEFRDRFQGFFRLILVRRVAAIGQLQQLAGPAHLPLDRVHLRHRAVLVLLALDRQHRALDRRQVFLDVPLAERRIQPGIRPELEGLGGILVVFGEPLAQPALS